MSRVDEGRDTAETAARGSDFLQLAVADVPAGGKAEWLAGRLRQAMADGRLTVGSRLPPTRLLAAELRVSRGVVTEAYRRLAEDGQVTGRRRGGTVVVATPFTASPPSVPGAAPAQAAMSGAGRADGEGPQHAGATCRAAGLDADDDAGAGGPGGECGPGADGGAGGRRADGGGGDERGGQGGSGAGGPCAGQSGNGLGGPDARRHHGETGGPRPRRDDSEPEGPDTRRHDGEPGGPYAGQSGNGPGGPDARRHHGETGGPRPRRDDSEPEGPDARRHDGEPGGPCAGQSGNGPGGPDARRHHGEPGGPCAGRGGGESGGSLGPGPAGMFGGVPAAEVLDALRDAPAAVDFTPGRPDLTTFPRAAWLRAERAVLAELSAEQLGYGDPRGALPLRRAVAEWLARMRGVRVEPDAVLVVAGTAQALTLLHPVLRADGVDAVAVEDPGSLGARQHLAHGGLATPPVPVDEQGVRVDALRATGARAVLLTPAHQFPTGVVTSGERRRELLEWAGGGGLILEDDYDAEHRYDRPPVPALRALLADRVCYLGSVSKLLAPALRIGWLVAPARYRGALVDAKRFNDLGNAVLPQLVLARLMESGDLDRHLRTVRGRHRRRRDAMIAALAEHLPGARVHGAAAGLHLTVTYAADVPDTVFAAAALARGVKCQPLSWHRQSPGRPGLVLGYAATPPGVVAEGVALLGRALRELG
ncbi:aminotransferase class I/II-fold pyridoxal phosphate-dependent enzyme [Streptomyces cinerochromogenes]|uniref:aminotransferase class I/II-fold pyridoxal phosphate-dependent enzyme n=1 Tax=Streptomyces cinerochromogenes TaxID=66422 RepID=UPI00198A509A|nr:aminotransferase class I/II-fold pyridoxal phosphate-dependent enzyme [Streptomyces cinerochromogenes]GGS95984.1 hypothetical protein GCM10010206_68400 [Streptomyces cinerochromogenes]